MRFHLDDRGRIRARSEPGVLGRIAPHRADPRVFQWHDPAVTQWHTLSLPRFKASAAPRFAAGHAPASRRRMSRVPISLLRLLLAQAAVVTACSPEQHLDLNAGPEGGASCGVVVSVPPVLSVVDATTGAAICDPTFTVVSAPASASLPPDGGNVGVPCTAGVAVYGVCAPDDAADACPFALPALAEVGTTLDFSVEVAKTGFEPAVVSVHAGVAFCGGGTTPASNVVVRLVPSDAGADGGAGASDAGEG